MRNVRRMYWTQCSGQVEPRDLQSIGDPPRYCKAITQSEHPKRGRWYCDDCKARMKKSGSR